MKRERPCQSSPEPRLGARPMQRTGAPSPGPRHSILDAWIESGMSCPFLCVAGIVRGARPSEIEGADRRPLVAHRAKLNIDLFD